MGEAKLRADEIDATKAQAKIAEMQAAMQRQAQATHMKLMEEPAIFAPSFYLADSAGMVRLIMHEPGGAMPIVRGSFVTTEEAILKLAEIAPQFVARMRQARAEAQEAARKAAAETKNGGDAPVDAGIITVDGQEAEVGAAVPVVGAPPDKLPN